MKKKDRQTSRYRCLVCDYVYDPAIGDPESGIAEGTSFEDLPEDWLCPVCGVGKEYFRKI
jgi:rubredoxin